MCAHQISRIVSVEEAMESRRLFLTRRLSISSGAQSSAAFIADEIYALLTTRSFRASVNRTELFIRSKSVTASGVAEMYRSVAVAGPPGQPLYLGRAASVLVEASARAALPDGALRLLDLLILTPKAPLPSGASCGHLMAKLFSLGRHADARRVFETLGDRQRRDAVTTVWRVGRAADAVKVFGETAATTTAPKYSSDRYVTMNMMTDCLMKGDLEAAWKLRTQMVEAGMKLQKHHQKMLQMLEKVLVCPDNNKRNVLIEVCVKAGGMDEAVHWLRQMGYDGMEPPSAHSYNLVIAGLWKAGRGDDAVKVFGEMTDMLVAPNHFTYTVMINGHLKRLSSVLSSRKNENGDLEAALALLDQMVRDGFKPHEYTCHLLMAEHCLAEWLGDVTALHKIAHGSLLEFLSRTNEDKLLAIIEESAKNGAAAAGNVCTTFVEELCRIQKVSLAEKVLRTFAEAGLVPTTEMYNIVIDGYCKTRDLQGAFLLCRQMESHDQLVPDEATYKSLLLAVRNDTTSIIYWEDVVELFEKNGISTDALNSGSPAAYGFKYRYSLVTRKFKELASKLF